MFLKLDQIKINKRIRHEYGDMEELANSIKEHGLLQPIVVDSQYNLVAGGRRLLACERIGLKEIEVKILGDLTERELRVLELEENIKRKDLTELEKSKALTELAELKAKELREKAEAEAQDKEQVISDGFRLKPEIGRTDEQNGHFDGSRQKQKMEIGRPEKPDSVEKIAQELGVPRTTLVDARKHLEAVEQYPELEDVPKRKALEIVRQLNNPKVVELEDLRRKTQQEESEKEDNYYEYIDWCGKVANNFDNAIYKLVMLKTDDKHLNAWKELLDQDMIESYIEKIDEGIPKLLKIKKFLKEVK